MISERTKALLSAASTIYAGVVSNPSLVNGPREDGRKACVEDAYALLAAIERREKANARCTCPPGPEPHLPACPRYEE